MTIATEGHSRYGFIQWQTITELMGKLLCMCAKICMRVCVCVHECVRKAGEHVYEVFQYSEAVKFSER